MKEDIGDIWDAYEWSYSYLIVTTNGMVRRDGACVMGAGIAKQAKERFPVLPKLLGDHLRMYGNVVGIFPPLRIVTFPVKHHWKEEADLHLIEQSAKDLHRTIRTIREFAASRSDHAPSFFSVRPGCGNGKRTWEEVRPVVAQWFEHVTVFERG